MLNETTPPQRPASLRVWIGNVFRHVADALAPCAVERTTIGAIKEELAYGVEVALLSAEEAEERAVFTTLMIPTPNAPTIPPPIPPGFTPAGFRMTLHADHPYEAFIAAGWTDALLLQYGYMSHDDAATRPTHLGDLPITADSLDRLDKAFTDLCERYDAKVRDLHGEMSNLRALAAEGEQLRALLKAGTYERAGERLRKLADLMDPEGAADAWDD